jgi:hypothetical protein
MVLVTVKIKNKTGGGWDHSSLSEAYSPLDTPRLFRSK